MIAEWLNKNSQRSYPFRDNTDLTLAGGGVMPNSTILDFSATVYKGTQDQGFIMFTGYNIVVPPMGPNLVRMQFFSSYNLTHTWNMDVPVNSAFPFVMSYVSDEVVAQVVFGEGILELTGAKYPVKPAYTEPCTILAQYNARVNYIEDSLATRLTGAIRFKSGYNAIVWVTSEGLNITVRPGAGKGQNCTPTSGSNCKNALYSINGINADESGNINIQAGAGLTLISDDLTHSTTLKLSQSAQELMCGG